MNQEKLLRVLLSPHVTNKTNELNGGAPSVSFKVSIRASKYEIKQAVSQLFEVKVNSVKTVRVKGKSRRFNGIQGRTKNWKKAYVRLEKGYDINFVGSD